MSAPCFTSTTGWVTVTTGSPAAEEVVVAAMRWWWDGDRRIRPERIVDGWSGDERAVAVNAGDGLDHVALSTVRRSGERGPRR